MPVSAKHAAGDGFPVEPYEAAAPLATGRDRNLAAFTDRAAILGVAGSHVAAWSRSNSETIFAYWPSAPSS